MMTEEYKAKLEDGLRFQDFVMEGLHRVGIVLQPICSKEGQLKRENLLGLEIKHDRRCKDTGNLYIETHEKTRAENPNWVCSGILRNDETWLYGIGDESKFWIFAKTTLREAYRKLTATKCSPWEGVEKREISTSRGFIIPATLAEKWAARVITWSNNQPL